MQVADWIVLTAFFLLLVTIGMLAYRKVKNSKDFFTAGGKLPWWLAGISHHVSGYSGVVFVAYAGLAYTHGFSLYIWWALTIAIGTLVGAFLIAPRWAQLREDRNIQSPTEYLADRYNLPTQQLIAWSGVLLKLFDVGAKWAAIAVLLNVFTGLPLSVGILLAGGVSLVYVTVGGLWADTWNDFAQFLVQIVAGITMLVVVLTTFGGWSELTTAWGQLPNGHRQFFNEPYTVAFALAFLFINFLTYNGGTWNLAMRFISSRSGKEARKAALLSSGLYLVWPLFLFVPMWLAPILLPDLSDPTRSYAVLAQELLPAGLVGLVLAGMFANTMSMTASDSNTISAVITRDILPVLSSRFRDLGEVAGLRLARITTFTFTFLTILVAFNADAFGGVLGLIVFWFGALVGPVAIPVVLGLLPAFHRSDARSAILCILGGFTAFVVVKYGFDLGVVFQVASPILVGFVLYVATGWLRSGSMLMVLPLLVLCSCDSKAPVTPEPEPIKGFMIDAARTVEQMDHYFRLIDFCGEWGFNTLIFRLTDDEGSAYRFRSHPELKTHEGALTRAELRELIVYASERGIDIIPEIESFGHTRYITDVEQYESLRDVGDPSIEWANGISPVNDTTFSLLVDLYDEVVDVFPSLYLHIGCDETNWGGNPLTQEALKTQSKNEIWADYVNRLHRYVKSKGKRTIIWGDVPIRDETEILDLLDKDIVFMDWNYGVIDADTVAQNARLVLESGFQLIGAPAANWFMWGPRVGQLQLENMAAFVNAYDELDDPNILGIAITHWVPFRYTQDSQWDTYALAGSMLSRPTEGMETVLSSFVARHFGATWDENWQRMFTQMYKHAPTYSGLQSVFPDAQGTGLSPWKSQAELLDLLDRPDTTANHFVEVVGLLQQLRSTVTTNQDDFEEYLLTAACIQHFVWRENAIIKLKWESDLTALELQAILSEIAAKDLELRLRLETSWINGRRGAMPDAHMWDFPTAADYARSLAESSGELLGLLRN